MASEQVVKLEAEAKALYGQIEELQEKLRLLHIELADARAAQYGDDYVFSDDELRYAATARCKCGAGMAYPKDADHFGGSKSKWGGAWFCSALLKSEGDWATQSHSAGLPFAFYEVISEDQVARANGKTTRPAKAEVAAEAEDTASL